MRKDQGPGDELSQLLNDLSKGKEGAKSFGNQLDGVYLDPQSGIVGGRFQLVDGIGYLSLNERDTFLAELKLRSFATENEWVIKKVFELLGDHSSVPNFSFTPEELNNHNIKKVSINFMPPLAGTQKYDKARIEITTTKDRDEISQKCLLRKE